jgi:hypothetical protein
VTTLPTWPLVAIAGTTVRVVDPKEATVIAGIEAVVEMSLKTPPAVVVLIVTVLTAFCILVGVIILVQINSVLAESFKILSFTIVITSLSAVDVEDTSTDELS